MAKKKAVKAEAPLNKVLKPLRTKEKDPKYGFGCRIENGIYVQVGKEKANMTASQFEKGYEWA